MVEKGAEKALSVVVKNRAEQEDGWLVNFNIPEFKSDYQIPIYKVPEEAAKRLTPGEAFNIVLIRENPRKGKDEDSKILWHFYWGWKGFAVNGAPPSTESDPEDVPDSGVPEKQSVPPGVSAHDIRIMRQASGYLVASSYWEWMKLPEKTRGSFREHLIKIEVGAKFLLNFYITGEPAKPDSE